MTNNVLAKRTMHLSAHLFPRYAACGIGTMCRQTALQFGPFIGGQRQGGSFFGDAVPDVLDQLDALGDWQRLVVQVRRTHAISILPGNGQKHELLPPSGVKYPYVP